MSNDDRSYYDEQVAAIADRHFVQRVFQAYSSLRSKAPQNGYFVSKPYHGESYDEAEWTLEEKSWDHEHCSLCFYKILPEATYWANADEVFILCEKCHERYFGFPKASESQPPVTE